MNNSFRDRRGKRIKLVRVSAFIIIGILLSAAVMPVPAHAAGGVQLITPYPAVSVDAGRSVTLNLEVRTPFRQRVELQVMEVPPNWTATLKGGGFVVDGVFGDVGAQAGTPPPVQLSVKVPADAAKGNYRVVIKGTSASGTDVLPIDIKVAEVGEGGVTLVPESPSLRGSLETPFKVNLTLTNNSSDAADFALVAQGPEGWEVTAKPMGQQQAATAKVEGGGTGTIELQATAPPNAIAGNYQVKVRATSGAQSAEAAVDIEVTGNVKLTLTTPDERLSTKAVAGKPTDFVMEVRNVGASAVQAVKVTGSPPTGWKITLNPETVPVIEPKKSAKVTAVITPSGKAVAGDYVVSFNAAAQGATDDVEIRTTVAASRLWLFMGLIVIGTAALVLLRTFKQYGRR